MARPVGESVVNEPSPAHRNRVICKGSRVPEGWVIVGECHNAACDGKDANAWIVKRAGGRVVVCAVSPLPEGYRRVRETRLESCPGEGDNAWVIERAD